MSVHGRGCIQRPETPALSGIFVRHLALATQQPCPVPSLCSWAAGFCVAMRIARDGQSLAEFAFILLLVALACVASVVAFGSALDEYYAAIIRGLPF